MASVRIGNSVDKNWGSSFVDGHGKDPSMHNVNTEGGEEEEENVIDYLGFSYLQASMFATVLEDTIKEIQILGECNNEFRVEKTYVDMTLLIAVKYEIAQPEIKDELEGIDQNFLGNNDYKLNKLTADRNYFEEVIITMYKEMTLYKTFDALQEYVNCFISTENKRNALCEDEVKNRGLLSDLYKQLRQQRNHIKSVIYDTDSKIDSLKSAVQESALHAEIESRYVENWQRARTEQHLETIADKEAKPSRIIENYKQRTDQEQRVHSEVELLNTIAINETLEKVEKWMNKYDKDMEDLDLKIQIQKNDYLNTLGTRIELETTLEKHKIMIEEWIYFKDEREKARLYREKMTNSAIIVQAWWRGLLVRRELGPYKVVKKKGGASKKK